MLAGMISTCKQYLNGNDNLTVVFVISIKFYFCLVFHCKRVHKKVDTIKYETSECIVQ